MIYFYTHRAVCAMLCCLFIGAFVPHSVWAQSAAHPTQDQNAALEALLSGDQETLAPPAQVDDAQIEAQIETLGAAQTDTLLPPVPDAADNKPQSKIMDMDLSKIPEVYLIEAENYRKHCEKRVLLRTYYNCECMALEYLETRIDIGPSMDQSGIVMRLSNRCVDVTQAAGMMYKQCHDTASLMGLRGDAEKFCSCVGNNYAKIYKASNVKPSSQTFGRIHSKAMRFCRAQQYNP